MEEIDNMRSITPKIKSESNMPRINGGDVASSPTNPRDTADERITNANIK